MRKTGSILLGIVIGITLVFMGGSSAYADPNNFGDLKGTVYGTNAVGTDAAWNRNAEYAWYKNMTSADKDITGWYFTDAHGGTNKLVFTDAMFPWLDDGKLPAGHSVIIYTGAGNDANDNDRHAVYRNHTHHYMNNGGDTLSLYDDHDMLIDRLSYSWYGVNPTP